MKKDIADKWVAALRSGEYKQAYGRLKKGDAYCCLGVLCDVLGREFSNGECEGIGAYLPESVVKEAGMSSRNGLLFATKSLADMNDNGMSFNFIADVIENYWEEL